MRGATGTSDSGGATIKEAARPSVIVVTSSEGERYGVKYDAELRNTVYDRTSSIMGESLGSAALPSIVSEAVWREALSGPGVFFEYAVPVKLSILDGWLGVHMPNTSEDILLRRVFVAFGEDKSRVYYQDVESGLFFGADTASAAGKAQELEIYKNNGAVFAYESGVRIAENAPYMLLMPGASHHPEIQVNAAIRAGDLLDMTLVALGHSNETTTTYYDSGGVLVCVGTQFNIRVSLPGHVFYRRTDDIDATEEALTLSEGELIERARAVAVDTIGKACGSAEVFLKSVEDDGEDSYSVVFGYYIAGGSVLLRDSSHAARVTLQAGTITNVELNFREFSYTGEDLELLPEIQAFAAAGGEFQLCYSDSGQETLQPAWVRIVENGLLRSLRQL